MTSILSNDQLKEVQEAGIVLNYDKIKEEKKDDKDDKEDKKEEDEKEKEDKELKDRISQIENLPFHNAKLKKIRDLAWFKLRVDLDHRESIKLSNNAPFRAFQEVDLEHRSLSHNFDISDDSGLPAMNIARHVSIAENFQKQKAKNDKKLEENIKKDSEKIVWYKSGKVKEAVNHKAVDQRK